MQTQPADVENNNRNMKTLQTTILDSMMSIEIWGIVAKMAQCCSMQQSALQLTQNIRALRKVSSTDHDSRPYRDALYILYPLC